MLYYVHQIVQQMWLFDDSILIKSCHFGLFGMDILNYHVSKTYFPGRVVVNILVSLQLCTSCFISGCRLVKQYPQCGY